jgi:hypothetical protein
MVNFWENDKNISPPLCSLEKNVGEDGFMMWGKIWEKLQSDKEGHARKFLAHATLFLMVPKCQSTPYQSLYISETIHYIYISLHV